MIVETNVTYRAHVKANEDGTAYIRLLPESGDAPGATLGRERPRSLAEVEGLAAFINETGIIYREKLHLPDDHVVPPFGAA